MFQFTRPAWGATLQERLPQLSQLFQFTRPAWGATNKCSLVVYLDRFQFTRPAWGATKRCGRRVGVILFQFTRPAWGATRVVRSMVGVYGVSIHAPRVGRDSVSVHLSWAGSSFNSRAPRGARLGERPLELGGVEFQFTRPAWGATSSAG